MENLKRSAMSAYTKMTTAVLTSFYTKVGGFLAKIYQV